MKVILRGFAHRFGTLSRWRDGTRFAIALRIVEDVHSSSAAKWGTENHEWPLALAEMTCSE
jgi:hypothetical protein